MTTPSGAERIAAEPKGRVITQGIITGNKTYGDWKPLSEAKEEYEIARLYGLMNVSLQRERLEAP